MISTVLDSEVTSSAIVAVNVRTFLGIDQESINIRYADMKDEEPHWTPALAPSLEKDERKKI